ncbi:cell filamentation protein Fic [Pseudoclavibacter sp. RFBI5]|uniref:Fic family protein n=1 Tax=Pseudoclavibacter sp. RFBI5 TaxID=2080578 RepID=UPI000CE8D4E2|nr:Fic family protein [Pseudoclavibacter sp. RFBI5]PPG02736.1 cell filamentation protein Fic [Pseudoclavibacter sp. RFBI5]
MRLLAGNPPNSWPSVTTATVDEEPRPGRTPATYGQAVVPFIAGRSFELTPETREVVAEATAAMHRFDERMREHPFAGHVLRVFEAVASSQMEGLQTPAVHLGEALIGRSADPAALEIARNLDATQVAEQTRGNDSTIHALEVHRALMDPTDAVHMPGELRQQLVWIGAGGGGPSTAAFVPPAWTSAPALMDDLAAYTASIRTHDALAKAAVAHAQFETIHPFTDGNGRTGRALTHTILRSTGQTQHVIVPVGVGLRARQQAYIDALTAYRVGDIDPIVTVHAEATAEAIWRRRGHPRVHEPPRQLGRARRHPRPLRRPHPPRRAPHPPRP